MAVVVIVAYNSVQKRAVEVSLQSDLDTASGAIEVERGNTLDPYPADESSVNNGTGLVRSGSNSLTYISIGIAYCVEASSPKTEKVFHYLSTVGRITEGPCAPLEIEEPEIVTTLLSGLTYPTGIAIGSTEFMYVAETGRNRILKVTSAGVSTVFAGSTSGASGTTNANGTNARFNQPHGLAVDANGNIYVADTGNHMIRKITPSGDVTTLAGSGSPGSNNGNGTSASFNDPYVVAVDPATSEIYITETGNHRIRKVTPSGDVSFIAGQSAGYADGTGSVARFDDPLGMAFYGPMMYVAEYDNNTIRSVTKGGEVDTVFGALSSGLTDGNGTGARFNKPSGVSVRGNTLFIADSYNHRIRIANLITKAVTTYAGTGTNGSQDNDISTAQFSFPTGVAASPDGKVFVVESNAGRVRIIQ